MVKIAFIWAENKLGYIGKEGTIPWSLPNDLQFFKDQTVGHPVVMGRKTFDSLNIKPLPKRKNIVLTKNLAWQYKDVEVVHSVAELNYLLENLQFVEDSIVFVIGGAQIYEALLRQVELLYITRIDNEVVGDTKMPPINLHKFELVKDWAGVVDERNKYPHHFYIYQKKTAPKYK